MSQIERCEIHFCVCIFCLDSTYLEFDTIIVTVGMGIWAQKKFAGSNHNDLSPTVGNNTSLCFHLSARFVDFSL